MGEVKIDHVQEVQDYVQLREPLWWNHDRTKLVEKGHADAAHAYGGISTRIPLEQAKADGLVKEPKSKSKAKSKK